MQTGNAYSLLHAEAFYDGLKQEGQDNILSLVCAWAGSQRYGALAWSGDVQSSFESFRCQVCAGLNMGLAGMPWWTTDIGGFAGGRADDASFRELLIRWFEFGAFSPVFRLHGHREPSSVPLGSSGGGICISGAPNEVWSFGKEAYAIFRKYLQLREKMRLYIQRIMAQAHENGTPVIRPLFYDFPADQKCWEIEDEYMFGPDVLVAPILYENQRSRSVYLPLGAKWGEFNTGKIFEGGTLVDCKAPIEIIPVFIKDEADVGFALIPR